jgi:hypothetical protein
MVPDPSSSPARESVRRSDHGRMLVKRIAPALQAASPKISVRLGEVGELGAIYFDVRGRFLGKWGVLVILCSILDIEMLELTGVGRPTADRPGRCSTSPTSSHLKDHTPSNSSWNKWFRSLRVGGDCPLVGIE